MYRQEIKMESKLKGGLCGAKKRVVSIEARTGYIGRLPLRTTKNQLWVTTRNEIIGRVEEKRWAEGRGQGRGGKESRN